MYIKIPPPKIYIILILTLANIVDILINIYVYIFIKKVDYKYYGHETYNINMSTFFLGPSAAISLVGGPGLGPNDC